MIYLTTRRGIPWLQQANDFRNGGRRPEVLVHFIGHLHLLIFQDILERSTDHMSRYSLPGGMTFETVRLDR